MSGSKVYKVCKVCNAPLMLGKFAYNQEVCWDCFEQQVLFIAEATSTPEAKEIVTYLLAVTREVHRIRRKEHD